VLAPNISIPGLGKSDEILSTPGVAGLLFLEHPTAIKVNAMKAKK
jgi:hypothetical protein